MCPAGSSSHSKSTWRKWAAFIPGDDLCGLGLCPCPQRWGRSCHALLGAQHTPSLHDYPLPLASPPITGPWPTGAPSKCWAFQQTSTGSDSSGFCCCTPPLRPASVCVSLCNLAQAMPGHHLAGLSPQISKDPAFLPSFHSTLPLSKFSGLLLAH